MAVTFEHHGTADVVIGGIDTAEALAHLCRSLEQGTGPDAQIVVIDLTGAPFVAQTSSSVIRAAAAALAKTHRWLGIVEPLHARATGETDAWYVTPHDALVAGRRYLSFVTGTDAMRRTLGLPLASAAAVLSWLPDVSLAVVSGAWRRITSWVVRRA